jgi:flagellar motor switch protein FliM
VPDREQEKDAAVQPAEVAASPRRTVVNCNFRQAGRLSNENARALTATHESFARHVSIALDAYLGTGLEIKLAGLEQLSIKEHIATVQPLTYLVPLSLSNVSSSLILECDIGLVFPIIELLLGGRPEQRTDSRELSEIEEEIMHDVAMLVAHHAESAWRIPHQAFKVGRRIKAGVLHQYCPPTEKVTIVRFSVELGGTTGSFQFVFPTAVLNVLLQQIKQDQPQKAGLRFFPRPSLRERILDCDIEIAAELVGLRVPVRDLIALEPGSVLKLRAPVRTPGMLTAGGQGFFEAMPVRNGLQKAAQLGRKVPPANWERGQ